MVTAVNEVTGDRIKSRPVTDKYKENYDKVFGKKDKGDEGGKSDKEKDKK